MKFLGILAIASAVNAATTFNLRASKHDSQYDGKDVLNRGTVTLGSDAGIDFVLNDDGTLVDGPAKKYINFNRDLAELSDSRLEGFSIKHGKLYFNGHNQWYGCPKDGDAVGFKTLCDDRKRINLKLENVKTNCDNVYPGDDDDDDDDDDKDNFQLKAWSTESDKFQNTPIMKVDEHPHVFSVGGDKGKDLEVHFSGDDGSLSDQDGRGVNHDSDTGEVGNSAPFGRGKPTPGFSIDGDHLIFEGKDNWRACPSSESEYSLANNDCVGGTPIVLQVVYV